MSLCCDLVHLAAGLCTFPQPVGNTFSLPCSFASVSSLTWAPDCRVWSEVHVPGRELLRRLKERFRAAFSLLSSTESLLELCKQGGQQEDGA